MSKLRMTGLICVALFLIAAAAPQQPTDLRLRADAADDLYSMNLTPDQLHALGKVGRRGIAEAGERTARA